MHYRTFMRKDYEAKGIPLHSGILTRLFGTGAEVKHILAELERMKFIVKVRNAIYNEKSAIYKLHENIEAAPIFKYSFEAYDSKLVSKLIAFNTENYNQETKQLNILKNCIALNEKGKAFFQEKYGVDEMNNINIGVAPQDIMLNLIYQKDFFAHRRDSKSRVYTNLTSLARDYRSYISFDDKPMLMTDISNSQILLTVPLLKSGWNEISGDGGKSGLPSDIKDFQALAESGKFYEHIAKLVNQDFKDADERAKFKIKVFEEIWFSKITRRKTKIKTAFIKNFPTVYKIIKYFKRNNHADFAVKLQRFEALIIIDGVWKKMNKMGKKVLTLHDAIICNNEDDLQLAENLITETLSKYGISPKFKRE